MPTTIEEAFGGEQETTKKGKRQPTIIEETASMGGDGISKNSNNRILAGFLYSFSRTEAGEFFPIYEGKNSIGNDPEADIALMEQTISGYHADIFIIKKQVEPKLDFRLKDAGSSNSTFCDDQQLFVGDVAILRERSIIKIGGYHLKIVLVDKFSEELGLNPNFKPSTVSKRAKVDDAWEQVTNSSTNKRRPPTE